MGIRATVRRCHWQRLGGWIGLCAAVVLVNQSLKQSAELEKAAQLAAHVRAQRDELQRQVIDVRDESKKSDSAATAAAAAAAAARPSVSSTGTELDCVDSHEACADWAAHGQCTANAGYMIATCALSCNDGCKRIRSPPPPPPPSAAPGAAAASPPPPPPAPAAAAAAAAAPAPATDDAAPPPPPAVHVAFHLPPAPPPQPCVDADRDALEQHWGQGVTDAYRRICSDQY